MQKGIKNTGLILKGKLQYIYLNREKIIPWEFHGVVFYFLPNPGLSFCYFFCICFYHHFIEQGFEEAKR
jgi:hypothetical protein